MQQGAAHQDGQDGREGHAEGPASVGPGPSQDDHRDAHNAEGQQRADRNQLNLKAGSSRSGQAAGKSMMRCWLAPTRTSSGMNAAASATRMPVRMVDFQGVPKRGCTAPKKDSGSRPSRASAIRMRGWPIIVTRSTLVKPTCTTHKSETAQPNHCKVVAHQGSERNDALRPAQADGVESSRDGSIHVDLRVRDQTHDDLDSRGRKSTD